MSKRLSPIKRFKPGRISLRAGLICLPLIVLFSPGPASAASRVWDGGCGGDTAWSCAGNWSGDVVPGPADTAIFSAKSPGGSIADPAFPGVVAAIRINRGYGGTIVQDRPIVVSTSFSQRSGAFDAGGENLFVKTFTLSGGTFVASSGTTSVGGNLMISGTPTFDANGGTIDFDRGRSTLSCNGVAFNQVTFSNTTGTKTVGNDCDLPLGESPTAGSGGSIKLNGALSGTGTLTTSKTLTLGSTGSLSGFTGLAADRLVVDGRYDFGSYTDFSVGGAFVIVPGGSFTAPAGVASFAGDFVNGGDGFVANGGTVVLNGEYQLLAGNTTFDGLTKSASSAATLTFAAGSMFTIRGTLTLEGASGRDPLGLASSAPGKPWLINARGARRVRLVSVSDSINKGEVILTNTSVDRGGNVGWDFGELLQVLLELIR